MFPIYGAEIERFAVLAFLKFCVIFVLTLTRDLKVCVCVVCVFGEGALSSVSTEPSPPSHSAPPTLPPLAFTPPP